MAVTILCRAPGTRGVSLEGVAQVRFREVGPLEEERRVQRDGETVGEAISKVQACFVTPLAVLPEARSRCRHLVGIDRNRRDAERLQQSIELLPSGAACSRPRIGSS
jgi:hypothetical protein